MSGQALQLQAELTSLAQEAKRKNPEIRTAAEKSLQDLKSLPSTSEQQLAADLSRRPNFIEPFLLACNTKNPKYAGSAANCLQKLVIIKGLPKSRLKDVLDAFQACTSLTLDVQLKVLQALPALAQGYADDLKGEQLAGALQVCAALQNVKTPTVSGVATATLQQLVVAIFDKVAMEDGRAIELPVVTEVTSDGSAIPLRDAAHDAYRVFLDIALATEGQKPTFVHFSNLSVLSGLELIGASMDTHAETFASHPELTNIVRTVVMPFLIRVISERQSFGVTLRAVRVAALVIRHHLEAMPEECEMVLGLLTHMLDPEASAGWKRAMGMEVFRMIYTEPGLAIQVYQQYDAKEGKKTIVRDNIATFVRLSTEKPSVIGLGQHSSIPTGPANQKEPTEQTILETEGGVAGVIGAALGVSGANVPGISFQWSVPKAQIIDQLDKTEPPQLPETYVYSLVLDCLNGLSENLAKVILPLSVQHENTKPAKAEAEENAKDGVPSKPRHSRKRSQSYRSRTVPVNPLELQAISAAGRVKATADLVDECWPALLATYSTFLNAALDNDYYRALIRSYQRFVQVSGLLRLTTARDAFLTTIGKSAVPSNVLTASMASTMSLASDTSGAQSIYNNAKGLLSVESFSSQASPADRRNASGKPSLSTRNLLCLRALLNVAIAIGPILESSFTIVFETLQQAGAILNTMDAGQIARDAKSTTGIGSEVAAVEAAALRLFESTADYPNDAFLHVLTTLCRLLDRRSKDIPGSNPISTTASPLASPRMSFSGRRLSSLPGLGTELVLQAQDYLFILTRLGELADLNVTRFTTYGSFESGWKMLVERLVDLSINATIPAEARRLAADILSRCSVAIAGASLSEDPEDAAMAQRMVLSSLRMLIHKLYSQSDDLTSMDVEIHAKMLEAVRLILEKCGESLTAGWDTILAILSTVFDDEEEQEDSAVTIERGEEGWLHLSSQVVAPYLCRSAFAIMQLVCSDFLAALPETSFTPLIEILYRFASQESDLNISLTTITLFWDVSDYLVKQDSVAGLNELSTKSPNTILAHGEIITQSKQSRSAQWLLSLYRIADVVGDKRSEVRNGAFQTLLRIFKNHADDLSTAGWQLCYETLLLKILREDAYRQKAAQGETQPPEAIAALESTSKTLLEETATLVSENIDAISSSTAFDRLWSEMLLVFQEYLSCSSAVVIAADFTGVATLLRVLTASDQKWKPAIKEATLVWSSGIPAVKGQKAEQEAYLAYADCAVEIYRLTKNSITPEVLKTMALDLYECVCASSGGVHGMDANNMTPLQVKILDCLKMFRTDLDAVASTLIKIASAFVRIPFDDPTQPKPKTDLTFIALSKASMDWLVQLLTTHLTNEEVFTSNSVARSLESLVVPIKRKYTWKINGKGPAPWQKAVPSCLAIIEPALHQLDILSIQQETSTRVWRAVARVGHEIMHADLDTKPKPSFDILEADEASDCENLMKLRNMIIPSLGSSTLPDGLRNSYVSSLFYASIIHSPEHNDLPGFSLSPMTDLHKIRLGRVRDPAPTPREEMAYLCLNELISLTTKPADESSGKLDRIRLAQASAPWLVLRLALPIKAYIADQPLRGSMPIPLSQVEELESCLKSIEGLICEPKALIDEGPVSGGTVKQDKEKNKNKAQDDERRHLKWLFPLLVMAAGVAGDRRHGSEKILASVRRVLDVTGSGL